MSVMHTIEARPYRWPWHGRIDARRTALLVCTGDDGTMPEGAAGERLAEVLHAARAAGTLTVWLPVVGTDLPTLARRGDVVVARPRRGGFFGTALDLTLRAAGRTDLLIAGFPFEIGADCTMREANDLGYECLLIEDCCSGVTAETFEGAVRSVQMSGGIFGAVGAAAQVCAALMQEG